MPSKAEELLADALNDLPRGSTGRKAILGVAYALIEVRSELARLTAALGVDKAPDPPEQRPFTDATGRPTVEVDNEIAVPPGIEKLSHCRSCNDPIFWSVTEKGRRMPIDASPNPEGRFGITLDGMFSTTATGAKYTSHFATCPNAAQHRKPGVHREP